MPWTRAPADARRQTGRPAPQKRRRSHDESPAGDGTSSVIAGRATFHGVNCSESVIDVCGLRDRPVIAFGGERQFLCEDEQGLTVLAPGLHLLLIWAPVLHAAWWEALPLSPVFVRFAFIREINLRLRRW